MKNSRPSTNSFGSGKTVYKVDPPKSQKPRYITNSKGEKRKASKEEMRAMQIRLIFIILACLAPAVLGLALYNDLPETIALHWDNTGNASFTTSRSFAVIGIPLICGMASAAVFYFSLRGNANEAEAFEMLEWLLPIACNVYLPYVLFIALISNETLVDYNWLSSYLFYLLPDVLALAITATGIYKPDGKVPSLWKIPMPWAGTSPETEKRIRSLTKRMWVAGGLLCLFGTGLFYKNWPVLLAAEVVLFLIPYLLVRQGAAKVK